MTGSASQTRTALALLLALPVIVTAIALDASSRRRARANEQRAIDAVARILPSNDLALSGGARWLRFPSMEEPGAAFQDAPAIADPDPAGGSMAPPIAVWSNAVR